jgi:release factor glutamine methyltransferase
MTAAPDRRTTAPPGATWRTVLHEATAEVGADDARRIVEEASGLTAAALTLALDDPVAALAGARVGAMVARRAAGEPLQYTLGRWGFRSLDLLVDRRVLIPRPETEQVVEVALAEGAALRRRLGRPVVAVDLGTGSGAIALSLAVELPEARVWATDVSAGALEVARANLTGAGHFAARRVRIAHGSWFSALADELRGGVDLIVANPPYVAMEEPLPPEVAEWEPAEALRAGSSGLECLATIIAGAPEWLAAQGVLVLELAPHQAAAVAEKARVAGFTQVEILPDLSGAERVLVARRI